MSDGTQNGEGAPQNDPASAEQLLPLVYDELRRLAAQKMANEAPGHTLQATALVHEAWVRLNGNAAATFANRAYFFAAAAEAMRRILIERARAKRAVKRGGANQQRVELIESALVSPMEDSRLLELDEALGRLAAEHPVEAELVKLRFFVGLTIEEAAEAMDISLTTAKTYWTHAKAWLFREIERQQSQ